MNILVTGANGQVGQELQVIANDFAAYNCYWVDRAELDITNQAAVNDFFAANALDYCINCAAYTAVDKAETDQENAHAVNVLGVQYLAEACAQHQVKMLHISTDYVYHNSQNTPFVEVDITNPQGVYAQTKLEGDLAALKYNPKSLVLRTSWVYSSFGHNFVKTMIKLGTDRDKLTIIFDQIGSPTYARDIAITLLHIVSKGTDKWGEVYHYSNEGVCSWYDFAQAIFELKNIDCHTLPIETKDYPTPAKRPHFSLLNKAKIKADFYLEIPYWRDSLKVCLELL